MKVLNIKYLAEEKWRLRSFRFYPYHRDSMSMPHSHNDIELNFVVDGSVTYLFGGQQVIFTAGKLYIFWAAIPHQLIQIDKGTRFFSLHLPLAYFLRWRLSTQFTRQILEGRTIASPGQVEADFNRALFERWHRLIETKQLEQKQIVLLEIEASLRYLALSARMADHENASPEMHTGVDDIEKMVSFITHHFQEPLTVAQIAAPVNLHPNYAMQLFKKYTGRTIITYLTQYRIAYAQHQLLTTGHSIADIAFDSGFTSLSRFYAAFKQICDISPTRYRQMLGQVDYVEAEATSI